MPFKEEIGHLKAYEDRLRLRKASTQEDNALLLRNLLYSLKSKKEKHGGGQGRGGSNNGGGRGNS